MGQAVGGEWDTAGLIGGAGASIKRPINIFTLKMETAMFAETLDNFQHSTRLISESRSFTLFVLGGGIFHHLR
jgi:hypothetical protein